MPQRTRGILECSKQEMVAWVTQLCVMGLSQTSRQLQQQASRDAMSPHHSQMSVEPSMSVWTRVTSAPSWPGQQPGACLRFEALAPRRRSSEATENLYQMNTRRLPSRQMTRTPQQTVMITICTRLLVEWTVQVAMYRSCSSTHSNWPQHARGSGQSLSEDQLTRSSQQLV